MDINGNEATKVEEEVDIPATEELVDGSVDNQEEVINEENSNENEVVNEPKMFTEEEFNQKLEEKINEILPRRLERKADKIRKEIEKKYSNAENLLKFGFNANTLEEAVEKMEGFYKEKGYEVPTKNQPEIIDNDYAQFKAEREAKAIIDLGYEEIKAETDSLSAIEPSQMSQHEKILLSILGEKRIEMESIRELESSGISRKALEDKNFIDFTKKLSSNLSIKEKYDMYQQFNPNAEHYEQIGSMKSNSSTKKAYKDYYTPEEARRLTSKDLDNPQIMAAVEKSMQIWQQNKSED